jgi:hypothetical protein
MSDLAATAPAFVDMAHRIVWASAALRLQPYRRRVMPGTLMLGGAGALLRGSAA